MGLSNNAATWNTFSHDFFRQTKEVEEKKEDSHSRMPCGTRASITSTAKCRCLLYLCLWARNPSSFAKEHIILWLWKMVISICLIPITTQATFRNYMEEFKKTALCEYSSIGMQSVCIFTVRTLKLFPYLVCVCLFVGGFLSWSSHFPASSPQMYCIPVFPAALKRCRISDLNALLTW